MRKITVLFPCILALFFNNTGFGQNSSYCANTPACIAKVKQLKQEKHISQFAYAYACGWLYTKNFAKPAGCFHNSQRHCFVARTDIPYDYNNADTYWIQCDS